MLSKKSIKITALIVSLALVSGCATQPSNVAASHVSSLKYDSVDCRRLGIEAADVEAKLSSVTGSLQSKANADAALVGASLILWPLLLGTMATGGKAEEQELARLKGEKIAIEQASLIKNCGVTIKDPASSVVKPEGQSTVTGVQGN